ncbi:MAG: hypothetical protein HY247_03835 [archaeon]|nr:MAG: hypothetical protein HY247_03835 [archaeon]
MGRSVKVHDDTHSALKAIKARKRSGSIDEVIREMVRATTGTPVEKTRKGSGAAELSEYLTE